MYIKKISALLCMQLVLGVYAMQESAPDISQKVQEILTHVGLVARSPKDFNAIVLALSQRASAAPKEFFGQEIDKQVCRQRGYDLLKGVALMTKLMHGLSKMSCADSSSAQSESAKPLGLDIIRSMFRASNAVDVAYMSDTDLLRYLEEEIRADEAESERASFTGMLDKIVLAETRDFIKGVSTGMLDGTVLAEMGDFITTLSRT